MPTRRFVVALALIASAAFVGRAVYIVTITRHETDFYDRVYYQGEAALIAADRPFTSPYPFGPSGAPDALHPPLTSLTLAPVAWLTNNDQVSERLTVALAGVAVVVLIGLIGAEVAGRRAGLIAAVLAAVYPNLWMNDGLIMSETFAALGTAAALYSAYRLIRTPSWRHAVGLGCACAVAMLSRAELVLLVPLVIGPVVVMLRIPGRARLRLAASAVGAALVVVAPWVIFNFVRFKSPVFLSNGDRGVLLGANCATTYHGAQLGSWYGLCYPAKHPGQLQVGPASQAFDYMGAHLSRLPVVVAARVGREWSVFRVFQMAHLSVLEGRPYAASIAGWVMFLVLMPLAAAGVVLLRRRRVSVAALLAPAVAVTVNAAVFYGLVRFRAPAEVSIVVLAAITIDAFIDHRRPARREVVTPTGVRPQPLNTA